MSVETIMSGLSGLDRFCGESFWSFAQTLAKSDARFSDCLLHTILVWIPVCFLWSFTPLLLYNASKSNFKPLPWTTYLQAKLVICLLLAANGLVLIIKSFYELKSSESCGLVWLVYPLLLFVSMLNAGVLVQICQRKGIITSGVLFLSWTLFCVCGLPEFYAHIRDRMKADETADSFRFVCYMIWYPLVCLQTFLHAFADQFGSDQIEGPNQSKELHVSFLNRLTYWWTIPLLVIGHRKPLEMPDLPDLNRRDTCRAAVAEWSKYWPQSTSGKGNMAKQASYSRLFTWAFGSLACQLLRCNATLIISIILIDVPWIACHFLHPQLLGLVLGYIEMPGSPLWVGFMYAFALFGVKLVEVFSSHQALYYIGRIGLNTTSMLTASIFTKALKLSNAARRKRTVGEIVNLVSVDMQKYMDVCNYTSMFFWAPIELILCVYFLYMQLGYAALTGVLTLALTTPFNLLLTYQMQKLQIQQMKLKDERLKMMNEIFSGIKVLKLYAWEKSMENLVADIRKKELHLLRRFYFWDTLAEAMWRTAPFLVAIGSFATFVTMDSSNVLTPHIAFVSLSLFNLLRNPMNLMPQLVGYTVRVYVSNKRVSDFLKSEEIDSTIVERDFKDSRNSIVMRNGTFIWDPSDHANTLRNITLEVPKGQLVAIVGRVGSGKSSLLSSLLGELTKLSGTVAVQGSVAYVPQQAWIQNLSLRENITFGKPFNLEAYDKTIQACALNPDIDILPAGDRTEIGEKGINLSGGQKARVSLARAVYQDSDIYLLDDPLSAVDSHVGKHIFEQVISSETGLLKNKTRILVTHGLTYLKHVDNILVLNDGRVSEMGTFEQLMESGGAFADILDEYLLKDAAKTTAEASSDREREPEMKVPGSESCVEAPSNVGRQHKLIEEETTFTGRVNFSVYMAYLSSFTWFLFASYLSGCFFGSLSSMGSHFWLAAWTNRANTTAENNYIGIPVGYELFGYGVLGIGQIAFVCIAGIIWSFGSVRASKISHDNLVHNLMRSPMSFFDTVPLGRILNRVGKDVYCLDESLPKAFKLWLNCIFQFISAMTVIIISIPIFSIVAIPMAVIYLLLLRFYVGTSRQLRRLQSVSLSPVYSHFHESVAGAACIRAYGAVERFEAESERRVDANIRTKHSLKMTNRWLGVQLELLAAAVVFFTSLFAILLGSNGLLTAGIAGLTITYALDMNEYLYLAIRETGQLETNIVSMERVMEYSETIREAVWETEDTQKPPDDWPEKGKIEFRNYSTRYREGLDLVLKQITATILPKEKVGVVGRTGAGKTTLSLSIFRIFEAASGTILIDGRNISKLGLWDLRSRLIIIPQDPVLFSGTLRQNLDPFDTKSSEDLWIALSRAHLKGFVQSLPKQLDYHCSEGGENLSVGQRQLLCLARALLRKSRILVLDEATAAVDLATDALVQETIRQEFKHCTIVTIAHRLNTILDYDRVMVLDDGKIVEFDSPKKLLGKKESHFFSMAQNVGIVS